MHIVYGEQSIHLCDYRSIQCEVALKLESLQKCERHFKLYRYVGNTMGIAYSTYKFRPSQFPLHTLLIPTPLNTISCISTTSYIIRFNSLPFNHSPSTERMYVPREHCWSHQPSSPPSRTPGTRRWLRGRPCVAPMPRSSAAPPPGGRGSVHGSAGTMQAVIVCR